jgi:hypothetical protein
MIAEYFNNLDLAAIVSAGNSGNAGNTNGKAPNNGALPVTNSFETNTPELVTGGNSTESVTDVTRTATRPVIDGQPPQTAVKPQSSQLLPVLPKLPQQRRCYWCKSTDMWLVNIPETTWRCRRCHPPVPGAEKISQGDTTR